MVVDVLLSWKDEVRRPVNLVYGNVASIIPLDNRRHSHHGEIAMQSSTKESFDLSSLLYCGYRNSSSFLSGVETCVVADAISTGQVRTVR